MAIDFVGVAQLDELEPGCGQAVSVGALTVALFNADGSVFAIDDSCIRCGSSLAAGTLTGMRVYCGRCEWYYDLRTGCVNGISALRTDTFAVRVVDSRIMIAASGSPDMTR